MLVLLELTIAFETSFDAARWRKEGRYADLVAEAQRTEFDAQLLTVEVGSRGIPGFKSLEKMLGMSRKVGIAIDATVYNQGGGGVICYLD